MDLSRILESPSCSTSSRQDPLLQQKDIPLGPKSKPEGANRVDEINEVDPAASSLSFIIAIEAKAEGRVVYCSESITDILGYEQTEALSLPASHFTHPDDAPKLYHAYQEMIDEDKAACLLYIRVPFKDPGKGYALVSITASRVEEHIIGSLSVVSSSVKAMHNASTATDVFAIAPSAAHLEYLRWNSPNRPWTTTTSKSCETSATNSRESSIEPSSSPLQNSADLDSRMETLSLVAGASRPGSQRVAIVLERFSSQCPILFATNDCILPRHRVQNRPFFDFVQAADEARVRKAIEAVKAWGVNESQQPSDGGFAFNRFHLSLSGRDSSVRPDPAPLRNRKLTQSERVGAQAQPYKDKRPRASSSGQSISNEKDKASSSSGQDITTSNVDGGPASRTRSAFATLRGVSAPPRKDSLLVDAIFSPQSDGILVILRPAKHTISSKTHKS